ncbi:hypothetical protein BJX64DRAFT_255869 [Aspergillus heterothallicus]
MKSNTLYPNFHPPRTDIIVTIALLLYYTPLFIPPTTLKSQPCENGTSGFYGVWETRNHILPTSSIPVLAKLPVSSAEIVAELFGTTWRIEA